MAEQSIHVRDPQALKALSHPVRLQLLGLLRLEGPATASGLGRRIDQSSGSTSYHLRELARFGFVEEVTDRGTARERWWRARHRMTSWQLDDFPDEGRDVADQLQARQLAQRSRLLTAWFEQRGVMGAEWAGAASLNDYALRLTPDQARRLADELHAVLARWAQEHHAAEPAEGAELVSVLLDVLPLAEYPL